MTKGSHIRVNLLCDYCNKKFSREYRRYLDSFKNRYNNKDCCQSCVSVRHTERFLIEIKSNQFEEILESSVKYENKICGIYSIVNKNNNKKYIGSSLDIISRWKDHLIRINSNTHCCDEFNYLKTEDLDFTLLEIVEDNAKLVELEYNYINLFDTTNKDIGYNIMKQVVDRNVKKKRSPMTIESKLLRSKLSVSDVKEIKLSLYNGGNISELAKKYSVNSATISTIKACDTWKDILPELNEYLISIKYENGLKGSSNKASKLNEEDVRKIKLDIKNTNKTLTQIAKEYKVNRTTISSIKHGKTWSHVD